MFWQASANSTFIPGRLLANGRVELNEGVETKEQRRHLSSSSFSNAFLGKIDWIWIFTFVHTFKCCSLGRVWCLSLLTGPPLTLALFSTRRIHPGPSEVANVLILCPLIFFLSKATCFRESSCITNSQNQISTLLMYIDGFSPNGPANDLEKTFRKPLMKCTFWRIFFILTQPIKR